MVLNLSQESIQPTLLSPPAPPLQIIHTLEIWNDGTPPSKKKAWRRGRQTKTTKMNKIRCGETQSIERITVELVSAKLKMPPRKERGAFSAHFLVYFSIFGLAYVGLLGLFIRCVFVAAHESLPSSAGHPDDSLNGWDACPPQKPPCVQRGGKGGVEKRFFVQLHRPTG